VKLSDALSLIRQVPDFPQPGILFHDITPLLANPQAFRRVIQEMSENNSEIDYVAGMEARGFIFASALSVERNIGFIPIRKSGKLPSETFEESYGLEYGMDTLEIHRDCCEPGSTILIVDDVLATGGTACAAIKLVQKTGASVSKIVFLLEIEFLQGRKKILTEFPDMSIHSLKMI
jgi:adenine phosphoribosyltransferase